MEETNATHGDVAPAGEAVVSSELEADRDLVDAIVEFISVEFPEMAEKVKELKVAVRAEFSGNMTYIPKRSASARAKLVQDVMSLFNGRNAVEVARRLNIGRATVYRIIKTEGGRK
jgi:Mor family transcriptional regulator